MLIVQPHVLRVKQLFQPLSWPHALQSLQLAAGASLDNWPPLCAVPIGAAARAAGPAGRTLETLPAQKNPVRGPYQSGSARCRASRSESATAASRSVRSPQVSDERR